MEIVLVVADDCPSCDKAGAIWEAECRTRGIGLALLHADSPQGAHALAGLAVTAVPAVLVDGHIIAVGLQSPEQVRDLLDRHVGPGDAQ